MLKEDATRTCSAYRAMAAVRNAVVGILHLHQVPNIAAQLRVNHRDPYQLPMRLLGLMTPWRRTELWRDLPAPPLRRNTGAIRTSPGNTP